MNLPQIEARRWFQQSRADMQIVRTLIAAGHYAAACFYSQQAGEKALKSVIYSQGARVVLGHSIRQLAEQCGAYDPVFTELMGEAATLDQFYIPTRYPNGLPPPAIPSETYSGSDAEVAQKGSDHILQVVEVFLHKQFDP